LIFSAIVFFSCQLQGSFFIFVITYYLTTMCGIVLAYMVAAVAPTMEAANALLPTYVTTCMYFGGLFIVFDKIPVGWKWYSYTSFLRYSWGALMLNNYQDSSVGEVAVFFDSNGASINVLEFYGLDDGFMSNMGALLGVLAGLVIFFGLMGALALNKLNHVKR